MSKQYEAALAKDSWDGLAHEAPDWFRDAKFGIFLHWGPYIVPAFENEWYSRNMYAKGQKQNLHHVETYGPVSEFGYKDFIPMFKGEKFNADEWADVIAKSGAKYAGPVTEHADNFSMWDSKVNPINSVNYGPHRDVTGECAEAFRKRGLKVISTFHHQWLWGWFMSSDPEADVYDPKNEIYYGKALPLETNRYKPYRMPDDEFCTMWRDKVLEVVEKYKPDALYFDSRTNIISDRYKQQMMEFFYNQSGIQDGIVTFKQEDFPAQTGVRDLECGRFSQCKPFPWQTDDRLEDRITWCYVDGAKYKSATRIVQQLIDVVAKNGNLLLNVGPKEDGTIPQEAKDVLFSVGDWLNVNGEAIYGTRPYVISDEGPTEINDADYDVKKINEQTEVGVAKDVSIGTFTAQDIRFTQKGENVYAILMAWPEGEACIRTLGTDGPMPHISSVELLGSSLPVEWKQQADGLHVRLPEKPCEHAYSLRIHA